MIISWTNQIVSKSLNRKTQSQLVAKVKKKGHVEIGIEVKGLSVGEEHGTWNWKSVVQVLSLPLSSYMNWALNFPEHLGTAFSSF